MHSKFGLNFQKAQNLCIHYSRNVIGLTNVRVPKKLVSISSMFYTQLLRAQIPKVQKN